MKKIIVFDMDDTLFPEESYVRSGFSAVNEFLLNKGIQGFYEVAMRLFETGNRGQIFNETLDELNVSYNKEDILELLRVYRQHMPDIELFEDALVILNELKNHFQLGLITDGYQEAQRNKIESLQLNDYFQKIIVTDELGREHWKPSKLPYELMKQHFNVEHSQLVYIGDNVKKDFVSANELGWTTIQIVRDNGQYKNMEVTSNFKAQYMVQSLLEINDILKLGSV